MPKDGFFGRHPVYHMVLETITELIDSLFHVPLSGLLAGMLLGVKTSIGTALYDAMVTTGTLHIAALSGMNISIVISFVNILFLRLLSRPIANLFTSILIIGYIWLVGISPSAIRAAIMGCLSLFAVSFGRQSWVFWSWLLASTSILAFRPDWITDISFQLSVMATLGIILFGSSEYAATTRATRVRSGPPPTGLPVGEAGVPSVGGRGGRSAAGPAFIAWVRNVGMDNLRVTLAAQVFTIPIIFFSFHRISLVSPLSNVLIGPLIAPITVGGFIAVGLGLVWLPLGQLAAWIVWAPLALLVWIVHVTARIPFASIEW